MLLDLVAVAYLVGSRAIGMSLGEFDVIAVGLLGFTGLFALIGARRIEVGPAGIRVFRRGRLRMSRPLSDFARLRPVLFGVQCIVFQDGAWVWLAVLGKEGTRIVDFLGALPVSQTQRRRVGTRADVVELPIAALRFPEGQCIGCQRPAETVLKLEARQGFILPLLGFSVARDIAAPGCHACTGRRTWLGRAVSWLPILGLCFALMGPRVAPEGETDWLKAACFAISMVGVVFSKLWGERVVDHSVLGVSALSLSADHTHVRLRVRDPALLQALEEGTEWGAARAVEGSEVMLG
ncbi:hypothetical protein ACLESD_22670 [Pyxidicoccus sp. 3LFB2]